VPPAGTGLVQRRIGLDRDLQHAGEATELRLALAVDQQADARRRGTDSPVLLLRSGTQYSTTPTRSSKG
jgi:hypothetical protein